MDNLPVEIFNIIVKDFDLTQLRNFCNTNRRLQNYCRVNRNYLLKKYFKEPKDIKDVYFLFKNKKELYEATAKKLMPFLDDEYPINQTVDVLKDFGVYVAKNWEKYITVSPVTVLLWYVHTLKSKPRAEDLKKIFDKIPKKIIKDIDSVDWFNTDNPHSNEVFKFIQ